MDLSNFDFGHVMDVAVRAFEAIGVVILIVGVVIAFARFLAALSRGQRVRAVEALRHDIGRTILLGLEILIIADIILTVTVEQTLASAATLGLIVLVRTFLSFSLDIELDGVLPWRRGERVPPAPGEIPPAS
jgi:uncharacterized membrane protein